MIRLAIDPGIRGCGVAIFEDSTLEEALYIKNPSKTGNGIPEIATMAEGIYEWLGGSCCGPDVRRLILEWPQIYRAGRSKAGVDANDLLPLAGLNCMLAKMWPAVVQVYKPHEWKGQVPKVIMCDRIRSRLSETELTKISGTKSVLHNVWDAVGLGLHDLGRL